MSYNQLSQDGDCDGAKFRQKWASLKLKRNDKMRITRIVLKI